MANKKNEEIKAEITEEIETEADEKNPGLSEKAETDRYFAEKKAEFDAYVAGVLSAASATASAAAAPAPAGDVHVSVPDTYDAPEWQEKVAVKLFKDNGRYKDDLFVAVNGKRYQIQRGVTVLVPRAIYEVIDSSQIQDAATDDMIAKLVDEARILS